MVSFSQARDMFRLQREAKRVKKELKNIHVEAEAAASNGGAVKVVVTAEQEVVSVAIDESVPHGEVGPLLTDALNRALKKAQVVAAEKMQPVMGELGLPGQGGS